MIGWLGRLLTRRPPQNQIKAEILATSTRIEANERDLVACAELAQVATKHADESSARLARAVGGGWAFDGALDSFADAFRQDRRQ